MPNNPKVLIAGAGPVGLTLANELVRHGISVRIVDKNAERTDKSKGTSKNGPVIDLLSMAPDVSWVRRGLVSAISGFLPPDAQVGA